MFTLQQLQLPGIGQNLVQAWLVCLHCFLRSFRWNHRRRLCRARGLSLLKMAEHGGRGGTVSGKTANKKLTKLYWPSRKRSPKRLIVFVEQKSGGTRHKIFTALRRTCAPTHFQIRSGATGHNHSLYKAPFLGGGKCSPLVIYRLSDFAVGCRKNCGTERPPDDGKGSTSRYVHSRCSCDRVSTADCKLAGNARQSGSSLMHVRYRYVPQARVGPTCWHWPVDLHTRAGTWKRSDCRWTVWNDWNVTTTTTIKDSCRLLLREMNTCMDQQRHSQPRNCTHQLKIKAVHCGAAGEKIYSLRYSTTKYTEIVLKAYRFWTPR